MATKPNPFYVLHGSAGDVGYFDCRYFPITIIYYEGPEYTEALLDQVFALRAFISKCAREAGTFHVGISGVDNIGVPKATTRQKAAEYFKKDKDEDYRATVNVISNPIFRGAMTAISWMSAEQGAAPQLWAKRFDDGLRKAMEVYRQAGVAPPIVDPNTYNFPDKKEFESVAPGFPPA